MQFVFETKRPALVWADLFVACIKLCLLFLL